MVCYLFLLPSLQPSVHPSLGLTGLGYIFSARAANWYACMQTNLKSTGKLIHWQTGICGTCVYAGAVLNRLCRIHTVFARRILKKHTQPLYGSCPSNFRISNFRCLFLLPTLRPSVYPSLGFTGLGYIFSVRAANWCSCNQKNLRSPPC